MNNGSDLIIGLDVGTTKICTVVAEADEASDGVRLIGMGQARSDGLRKGIVVDMDAAVASIVRSVEAAEKMANVEINSVFAGIAGGHVASFNSRGVAAIGEPAGVTARDVERAVSAARAVSLPAGREILHTIPQEFVIDGEEGIKDPEGMSGVRLEAEVHIVTGAVTPAQNVVRSINRAGLEVEDIVLESLASGISVLSEDEKNSGVLLIDIGGGTTDYLIFQRGSIRRSDVIAVGGDHVTNDVSMAFRIPLSRAEEVKEKYGCALEELVDGADLIEIPDAGGRRTLRYSRRDLARVVELRMEEILSIVNRQLEKSALRDFLGGGVVLTGGASLPAGIVGLARRVFGLPVRLGAPRGFSGLTEVLESPIYATGTGLARYGYRYRKEGRVSRFRRRGAVERFIERITGWLRGGRR